MKKLLLVAIISFLMPALAYSIIITDTYDGDNDFIPDLMEYELAKKYLPILYISTEDYQYWYPNVGHRIPFSADSYVDETGQLLINISLGLVFTQDKGTIDHVGDPEFCQYLIRKKSQYTDQEALVNTDAWDIISEKSFAHVGTPFEHIDADPISSTPIFWVSNDKHGIYNSSYECNDHITDDCYGDHYIVGNFYNYLVNIGSNAYANSPYIDRYIYDNSQNCYVNIWDGVDFPYASEYMSDKKFATFPTHGPYIIQEIYQPGGPNSHIYDNISGIYPNPVGDIKFQASNLNIMYRDAYVRIYNETPSSVRYSAIGRVNSGNRPIRLWDTVFVPSWNYREFYGEVQSYAGSIRQMSRIGSYYYPDGGYYYPAVSSITVLAANYIRVVFTEPVNFTDKSIKLLDNTTEQIYLGTVSPVVTMFGGGTQNINTTYYFNTQQSMILGRSYSVWITKQDVISGIDGAVYWTYPANPYYIQDVVYSGGLLLASSEQSSGILIESSGIEDSYSWIQFQLVTAGWVDIWTQDAEGNSEQIKSSDSYFVPASAKQLFLFKTSSKEDAKKYSLRLRVKNGNSVEEKTVAMTSNIYDDHAAANKRKKVSALSNVSQLPKAFSLLQNNPNPFNPSTSISFSIPDGETPTVNLGVYSLRGQLVKSLISASSRQPGTHTVFWDGTDRNGRKVASGVYLYRLNAGKFVATKKWCC